MPHNIALRHSHEGDGVLVLMFLVIFGLIFALGQRRTSR